MKKNMMIISMDCFEAAKSDAYIDGKVAGRKEVLDKLEIWIEEYESETGRKFTEWIWGKRRIKQFIKENSSPSEGGE